MPATMTTAKPTDEQLRTYADALPDIYKDVLREVPTLNLSRGHGEPFKRPFLSLAVMDNNPKEAMGRFKVANKSAYLAAEVNMAIERLMERGFFVDASDSEYDWLAPTELGERLITTVTKWSARRISVPELPKPTW